MQPLAAKGPFLACWLIAGLVNGGSPEYSDKHPGSLSNSAAASLSSSVTDACKAGVTTTVFVTLTSVHHDSTVSISDGANVETTTITVAPVQSHAKTDTTTVAPITSGASSTTSGLVHGPATGSSSSGNIVPASDISSAEYSSAPRTSITLISTRTVTFTLVPASKGIPLTSGTVVSDIKGTTWSSSGGTSASLISDCVTHTVVGPDGRTTIVESTFISPGSTAAEGSSVLATADSPVSASVTAPGPPVSSPSNTITSGLPIHTSFTVIGPDGAVSVIYTTWIIPVPPTSSMSGLGPFPTEPASSGRVVSGISSNPITQSPTEASLTAVIGTTACTTLTVVGPDGKTTVSEVTIISPTGAPTATSNLAPPPFVTPASVTDLAIHPATSNSVVTTITWTVTGADGTVSGVVETITAPPNVVSGMPTHLPSAVTVNISQPPAGSKSAPVIPDYVSTAAPVGPSASGASSLGSGIGIGSKPPFVPLPSQVSSTLIDEPPAYTLNPAPGTPSGSSSVSTPATPSDSSSSGDWVSSILYGSLPLPSQVTPLPATPVLVTPVPLPVTLAPESPAPVEPLPTPIQPTTSQAVTLLTTTTWTNIIPESTTTYVMKFPVTTMATVTVPRGPGLRKRHLRRQSSVETLFPWSNSSSTAPTFTPAPFTENTSLISSLSSQLVTTITTPLTPTTIIPTVSLNTPTSSSVLPPISVLPPTSALPSTTVPSATPCPSGAKVGNQTINFDNLRPGPLLNPAADLWFSEGFLVVPPSSPPSDAYLPSSGTQLVEFLPPALVPGVPFDGTGNVAEISVGPNEVTPCFRFNFYGASLGCAAEGVEQWCEFEFSAYTYNETSKSEASLSWSETRRVPACPQFPQGPCPLTPIQLDGYNNIASILVTVRVGLELRAWWGDDFQIGWSDNSCEAATCRSNAIPRLVKRQVFSRASRRGVWQWTPNGAKKLDDDYVWSSFDY